MYMHPRKCAFIKCPMTGFCGRRGDECVPQNEGKGMTVSGSNNLKTVERVDHVGKLA